MSICDSPEDCFDGDCIKFVGILISYNKKPNSVFQFPAIKILSNCMHLRLKIPSEVDQKITSLDLRTGLKLCRVLLRINIIFTLYPLMSEIVSTIYTRWIILSSYFILESVKKI